MGSLDKTLLAFALLHSVLQGQICLLLQVFLDFLIEAEDAKKRWKEYTEELYKKDLHDPDNHDGVITHLSQTSWNVKSSGPSLQTKLVEVMEFQLSYLKS